MKHAPLLALAALVAASALGGCATTPAQPPPRGDWTLQASAAAGAALVLGDPGHATLRVACRRNPADLFLSSDELPPSPTPVRLSVGRHDFMLTPEPGAPRLAASGPLPDDLPAALMSGGLVRLRSKGVLVMFSGPDAKTAAAFSIACGRAAG